MKPWVTWLIVWLAVAAAGLALRLWLAALGLSSSGLVAAWVAYVFDTGWMLWGIFRWRDRGWVRILAWLGGGAFVAGGLAWLMVMGGSTDVAIGVVGLWCMAAVFFLGLGAIRALLRPSNAICAVARTLIDEAVRMRIAVVFVVLLALVLPFMPAWLDPTDRLEFRMQTYLNLTLTMVKLLLALMTILVACRTISFEVAQRQIHLTLTKPVARWKYLLGKWLGLALLNLLLVVIAGTGVYVFARVLERQPDLGPDDRAAVEGQVLTARTAMSPAPPAELDLDKMVEERLRQLHADFPKDYPDSVAALEPAKRKSIENSVLDFWHTIPGGNARLFVFTGLPPYKAPAAESPPPLPFKLRLKPRMSPMPIDGLVHFAVEANGYWLANADRDSPKLSVIDRGTLEMDVPAQLVDAGGRMSIAIFNPPINGAGREAPPAMTFTPGEGIKLFRGAGDFAPNLIRAMAMIWVRLLFLAILGLMAGAFLTFPVACLVALSVFAVAASSGFLGDSLTFFATLPDAKLPMFTWLVAVLKDIGTKVSGGEVWDALKIIIKLLGIAVVNLFPSFADFDPVPNITDGQLVPLSMLAWAVLKMGVLWTGVCGLVAWLLFRKRELARIII